MGAEGVEGVWTFSVPSTQYCCEPEIALKNKAVFNGKNSISEYRGGGGDAFLLCKRKLPQHPARASNTGTQVHSLS